MRIAIIIGALLLSGCQTVPKDWGLMADHYREFETHPRYQTCLQRASNDATRGGYDIRRRQSTGYTLNYNSPYSAVFIGCIRRG